MTTTANISATINGITFNGLTIEQAQALAGMAMATVEATAKPKAKRLITSQGDTAPKRTMWYGVSRMCLITSQGDTAPKLLPALCKLRGV